MFYLRFEGIHILAFLLLVFAPTDIAALDATFAFLVARFSHHWEWGVGGGWIKTNKKIIEENINS